MELRRCMHNMISVTCAHCTPTKIEVSPKLKAQLKARKSPTARASEKRKSVELLCNKIINEAEQYVGDISYEWCVQDGSEDQEKILRREEMLSKSDMRSIRAEAVMGFSSTFRKSCDYDNMYSQINAADLMKKVLNYWNKNRD